MVTYLDLLNDARGRQGSSPLSSVSIVQGSGDSLRGLQAVNQVINHLRLSSVDLDFSDARQDVSTVIGDQVLTSPAAPNDWNPQLISQMWVVDQSNLLPVEQITPERATELEFYLTTQGRPLFFYIREGAVKVVPTPDQVYTIRLLYQTTLKRLTASNITGEVIFPEDFNDIFTDGVFAQLRRTQADPEWRVLWDEYRRELSKGYMRNKHNLKWQGKRLFRMRPSRDRSL